MTWVLIPVAIAINIVVGQIVITLRLPVFLDTIGTVMVGVIAGPWAGALTGALSNIIWGLIVNPDSLNWFLVAAAIGFVAGLCANAGLFKTWWKVIIAGILIAVAAVLTSTPINIYLYGGLTPSPTSLITAAFLRIGLDPFTSVLFTNLLVEPIDKIPTALLAFLIIKGLSVRYLSRFPRPENVITTAATGQL